MAHEMHMGDDGILRVKLSGDFDRQDVEAYVKDYEPFLAQTTGMIDFLVDVSEVGKASSGARKAFGEMFSIPNPRAGYTAVVGANRYVRVVAGFVTRVTGATNLRLFDTEDPALAWLRGLR
jgi:hypothetical protein